MEHLYISDLDKTLLRSDLSLSPFTIKTWNRLAQKGVHLTIATARSGPKSLELLKALHLHHPLIVMDGAMTISSKGEILSLYALTEEIGEEILRYGARYGLEPFVIGLDKEGKERFCYGKTNALQKELIHEYRHDKRLQKLPKILPLPQNIKIVYIDQKEPLLALKTELEKELGKEVEIKFAKDPYIDGYFLTLLHPNGDKAHAFKALKEQGYNRFSTTMFGDSHNDLGIFALTDQKIAVANAVEELKAAATHILPHTNDEDGVAHYLYQRHQDLFSN